MFNHISHGIDLKNLESHTSTRGRKYFTDHGEMPSITTVLSILSREAIADWRERVGEDEAKKILRKATTRGTSVHKLWEDYVNNVPNWENSENPFELGMFKQIQPELDKNLSNIWFQEAPLYSTKFQMAGRVDVIAEWGGKLSVIDFKTSGRLKKYDWVTNYFMQAAFYAAAFFERTGQPIKQLVVAIATDDGESQIFVEPVYPWLKPLMDVRDKYKEIYKV